MYYTWIHYDTILNECDKISVIKPKIESYYVFDNKKEFYPQILNQFERDSKLVKLQFDNTHNDPELLIDFNNIMKSCVELDTRF